VRPQDRQAQKTWRTRVRRGSLANLSIVDAKPFIKAGAALLALLGASLLWKYTALADLVRLDALVARAEQLRRYRLTLVLAPAIFVGLSLALVPITLLRAATVIAFGPLLGPVYALVGSVVAAFLGYELGRHAGGDALTRLGGKRLERIRERVHAGGVWAMAALRLVPLGPYTFVNAACGAAKIRRRDFLLGTTLVMIPVLVIMAIALKNVSG
jgi:phospholipase D1/2